MIFLVIFMKAIMEKLNYIKRTGMYVDKLRNGKTYDDQSGCMINNADMLRRMIFLYRTIIMNIIFTFL